jgi:hypothetical protein
MKEAVIMVNNSKTIERKSISYDAIFKRFVEHLSDENIIGFINGAFGKNLDTTLPVSRLNTESNSEKRLVADIYLRVGDSMYNLELQSSDDESMAVRMFEYGFRGAKLHGTVSGTGITLRFPEPVVIYLRTTDKTPRELSVNVEFPHIDQTVCYTVPAKRLSDLTPEMMLEQKLFPLLPFYPMKFESAPTPQEDAKRELQQVGRGIKALHDLGKLSETEAADMLRMLCEIGVKTAEKMKNIELKEVVENMAAMETLMTYDTWEVLAQAKAEGKAEGKEEMLRAAIKSKLPSSYVRVFADQAGISEDRYEQIVKEMSPPKTAKRTKQHEH